MRIWIVNQDADTQEGHGPSRHYDLAIAMAKRGHEITLITGNYSHIRRKQVEQPSHKIHQSEQAGIQIIRLPTLSYKYNNWKRFVSALCFFFGLIFLKSYKNKPDIIIGSSPNPISAYGAYLLAKRLHCRFIYEIRDLWPETLLSIGKISPRHPVILLFSWIEKQLALKSTQIIAVLPGVNEYLRKYNIAADKIVYLPNFTKQDKNLPMSTEKTDTRFCLMYLGAHNPVNDLKTLLYAAQLLQQQGKGHILIQLIGSGNSKQKLMALSERLGLKNIEFLAPVPKQEISPCLMRADAFVILWQNSPLYRWGTSPNKIFDYMGAGKPIIEAINPGQGLVEKAHCGITVAPASPEALAQAIITLSEMPKSERDAMGLRGFEFATKFHHIDNIAAQLELVCSGRV